MGTALPYPGSSLIGGTSRDECCSNVLVLQVLEHVGRLLDVLEHLVPLVQLAAQRRVEAERKLQARLRGRQLPCCSERSSCEEHAPFQCKFTGTRLEALDFFAIFSVAALLRVALRCAASA